VFQPVAIVGGDADVGVEAEPIDQGAAAAHDRRLSGRTRPNDAPDARAPPGARGHDACHRCAGEAGEQGLAGDAASSATSSRRATFSPTLRSTAPAIVATSSSVGAGTGSKIGGPPRRSSYTPSIMRVWK